MTRKSVRANGPSLAFWPGRHLIGVMLLAVLSGCGWDEGDGGDGAGATLDAIREAGELRVITRNSPTTYYYGRDREKGLEYDLARRFADELGVELRLVVINDIGDILDALAAGKGHIAAAGLTVTPERRRRFDFGPAYQKVRQEVVCRRGGAVPDDWDDLPEVGLLVLEETSYTERLREIKQVVHDLEWEESGSSSAEEILERVWRGKVDCTVADSHILALNQRYYPELKVAFPITQEQELAWALPEGSGALQARLEDWFAGLKEAGDLAAIRERYFGHFQVFDYVEIAVFQRRMKNRLPGYKALFQEVAGDYPAFSWELLAAQAYQESHWQPLARSPTGVRGMMMLTRNTASSLGIDNRLNVQNSIRGGAEYLARMWERLPQSIEEPDRTWAALAAYNVGRGHIRDARRLAEREGLDPDSWNVLKRMLPRLSQPQYYKTLPHGYARGREPVKYVMRIRQYYQILKRHFGQQGLDLQADQGASAAPE
ncbi:membrane-bound lytic murein transglycosylase MltF [Thiohalorhabdus sp.]|uniref:membrane-bound lytic murein transglycosylase MltF n=1 Tax=Thiohalorhabdus sp. TaxID=3094134 RepID=UPI002FC39255